MSKPIALWATDPHLTKDNVDEVADILDQTLQVASDADVAHVILGGDLFNSRIGQPLAPLECVHEWKRQAKKLGITIHAIPGNHDKPDTNEARSFMTPFSGENFILYAKPSTFEIDNVCFSMLPYFREDGKYPAYLNELARRAVATPEKTHLLMTHIAVNSVRNNDGSCVENDLKPALFDAFDKVLVGHYHNASQIANIHYTGSTHPQSYGEDNEKGFTMIYDDGSIEHVRAVFKKYHTMKLYAEAINQDVLKQLQEEKNRENMHLRVIVQGTKAQLSTLSKRQFTEVGIYPKFESNEVVAELAAALRQEAVVFNASNIKEQFDEFCLRTKINTTDIVIGRSYLNGLF